MKRSFKIPTRFPGVVKCKEKFIFVIFVGVINEEIFTYSHGQNHQSTKAKTKKFPSELFAFAGQNSLFPRPATQTSCHLDCYG